MSFSNSGKNFTREGLRAYLAKLKCPSWVKGVTFHHTATPALSFPRWSGGWTPQLIANMRDGYINNNGWGSGPHFYPDDNSIWGLTPPTEKGIHAKSFNSSHIGIEVLGNFDVESHTTGRGAKCWLNAFECAAEVLAWAGLKPSEKTINFHRDDPKTNKTCPGDNISKQFVIEGVVNAMKKIASIQPSPRIMVGISDWLSAMGRKEKITKKDGQVMVGNFWIESAIYDKERQVTIADEAELIADILK